MSSLTKECSACNVIVRVHDTFEFSSIVLSAGISNSHPREISVHLKFVPSCLSFRDDAECMLIAQNTCTQLPYLYSIHTSSASGCHLKALLWVYRFINRLHA